VLLELPLLCSTGGHLFATFLSLLMLLLLLLLLVTVHVSILVLTVVVMRLLTTVDIVLRGVVWLLVKTALFICIGHREALRPLLRSLVRILMILSYISFNSALVTTRRCCLTWLVFSIIAAIRYILFIIINVVILFRAGLISLFVIATWLRLPIGEEFLLKVHDPLVLEDFDQRDSLICIFF